MQHEPPDLSPASRRFVQLAERTTRLSRKKVWAILVAATALTALLDLVTGRISVGPAYLLLVFFAAWSLRGRAGFAATTMIVLIGIVIGHVSTANAGGSPLTVAGELWNGTARFLSNIMIALIVSGFRSALELERWRADTDGLTGVLNQDAFNVRRTAVVDRARRDGGAVVLAYMDLDGFKQVNDRHGHSAGDRVLRRFAQGANDAIRSTDLFARIGGDEFVALLAVPDCNAGDGVAEMLHARLSAVLRETGFAVTCSMGALIATAALIDDGDDMIGMADRLMYEVKRSGKDALRIARGDLAGDALRAAFPPVGISGFDTLLVRIDHADRALTTSAVA